MATPDSEQLVASTSVVIIGAGPIGLELAAALKRAGMDYLHFDAHQIGYTISWWPRNTHFFSTTERIEIAGIPAPSATQERLTGEEYLAYLRSIVEQLDLKINTYEPVTDIQRLESGFCVITRPLSGERRYHCWNIVLATGDMHAPNRLGIPGEDLPHVSHYFRDPHLYFRKRLLVVGGRNSAVEAALRCWRAGSQVTISYRRAEFDAQIVKHFLLPDLRAQIELGTIAFLPQTTPVEITPGHVILERIPTGERIEHPTDFVLLATGFTADMSLFQCAEVNLLGEECAPQYNPETMETNVPGIYVAGTAAAGSQKRYTLFIENCHAHVGKIVAALTGHWPDKIGTIPARQYDLPTEDIQAN
jgi:thioredoxin reductase (NADPH)